jgi:hypothetical protein
VHLLLGDQQDPCCLGVRTILEAGNYPTRIIANPLAHPWRLAWLLNNEQSASQLVRDEEAPVLGDHITGVLVRSTGWVDPVGWQPDDLTYMQTETRAALLAWLWSLACPVVNRYAPAIWYQPQLPLLTWQRLLRRSGLPTLGMLVTNVEQEARAFGQRLALKGVAGAVYGPITSDVRYLVTSDEDWSGLTTMQRYAPVCLASPYGAAQLVCVVGEKVVWEGEPSPEAILLEPALRRFAAAAGLAFVELALASTSEGICVTNVEPHPHFERFGDVAQQQIVEGIVHLLTAKIDYHRKGVAQTVSGGLS